MQFKDSGRYLFLKTYYQVHSIEFKKIYTLIGILEEDNRKKYTGEGILRIKSWNIPGLIKRHILLHSINTI